MYGRGKKEVWIDYARARAWRPRPQFDAWSIPPYCAATDFAATDDSATLADDKSCLAGEPGDS